MVSSTEIAIICGIAVSTIASIIAIFRKHIKKSSCCGSSVEFNTNTPRREENNQPNIIITPSHLVNANDYVFPNTPRRILV